MGSDDEGSFLVALVVLELVLEVELVLAATALTGELFEAGFEEATRVSALMALGAAAAARCSSIDSFSFNFCACAVVAVDESALMTRLLFFALVAGDDGGSSFDPMI